MLVILEGLKRACLQGPGPLNNFWRKDQKKMKKLKTKEAEVVRAVREWAGYHPEVQLFRFHVQGIPTAEGGMRKNENKGAADFMLQATLYHIPVLVWFECKGSTGKLTENQKHFRDSVLEKQGFYFVVQGIQDCEDAIESVRRTIRERAGISTGYSGRGPEGSHDPNYIRKRRGHGNPPTSVPGGNQKGALSSQMRDPEAGSIIF